MVDKEKRYKGKMYHYADEQTVKSILEKTISFYCTHEEYFDDTEEGKHIETVFNGVLKDLIDNETLGKDKVELMEKFKFSRKKTVLIGVETEDEFLENAALALKRQEAYICCFSKLRDSKPLWDGYIRDRSQVGYSLEFDSGLFYGEWSEKPAERLNCINPQNILYELVYKYKTEVDVKQVIYDNAKKSKIVRDIIMKSIKDYDKTETQKDIIYESINNEVSKYRYLFKRECFKNEEEVRCIIRLDLDLHEQLAEIKYRKKENKIIPYLEIKLDMTKHFLTGVTIEPKSDKEKAATRINAFLADEGYNGVKIYN